MAKLKYKNGSTWTEVSASGNALDAWPIGSWMWIPSAFITGGGMDVTPASLVGGSWARRNGTTTGASYETSTQTCYLTPFTRSASPTNFYFSTSGSLRAEGLFFYMWNRTA